MKQNKHAQLTQFSQKMSIKQESKVHTMSRSSVKSSSSTFDAIFLIFSLTFFPSLATTHQHVKQTVKISDNKRNVNGDNLHNEKKSVHSVTRKMTTTNAACIQNQFAR